MAEDDRMTGRLPVGQSGLPVFSEAAATERICARVVDGQNCGRPATVHIIWAASWSPLATHPIGPCCGMPGSQYFIEENECRYEDGLPTVEPVRAVAQMEMVA